MPFISLDYIHPYQPAFQPPSSAFELGQRRLISSKRVALDVPVEDFDIANYIDLTTSLPTDPFDLSRAPVEECGSRESNDNDYIFPAFENLLQGVRQAQEPPFAESTNGRSSISPMPNTSATEERGGEHGSLTTPPISVPGSADRAPTLRDKSYDPISSPLPPPPPPLLSSALANTALPLTLDVQTEPGDGASQGIGPPIGGQEKADRADGHNWNGHNMDVHERDGHEGDGQKGDGHNEMGERDGDRAAKGATGVPDIRGSSKRTADIAGINGGGERVSRSEKIQRTGSSDVDEGMSDCDFARRRSLPKPVFRYPPRWRDSQERKNTSSGRPTGPGESQDDPLVVEDDGEETDESGTSTGATSVEPETETAPLSSHPEEEPMPFGCLDAPAAPDLPTEPLDRPTSPDVAPTQHSDRRVGGEDDNGTSAVANPPSSIPVLHQQHEADSFAPQEREEWEIKRIVGKRRAGEGDGYLVRWKNTWLSKSELGNAQCLIQEFEARRKARRKTQRGPKQRRSARAN